MGVHEIAIDHKAIQPVTQWANEKPRHIKLLLSRQPRLRHVKFPFDRIIIRQRKDASGLRQNIEKNEELLQFWILIQPWWTTKGMQCSKERQHPQVGRLGRQKHQHSASSSPKCSSSTVQKDVWDWNDVEIQTKGCSSWHWHYNTRFMAFWLRNDMTAHGSRLVESKRTFNYTWEDCTILQWAKINNIRKENTCTWRYTLQKVWNGCKLRPDDAAQSAMTLI